MCYGSLVCVWGTVATTACGHYSCGHYSLPPLFENTLWLAHTNVSLYIGKRRSVYTCPWLLSHDSGRVAAETM